MNRAGLAILAAVLVLSVESSPSAHHSFAAHYDMEKPITIEGTIVQVRLTNPHSWFFLDVKEADGATTRWAFEAGTPSGMIRNGYKASELPPGTVVTITGFHARDHSQHVGMLRQLTTADGRTYGMFGPQEGPGAR
jgi:DNA/RNA endonuclease YhcR with UshA esterase domain